MIHLKAKMALLLWCHWLLELELVEAYVAVHRRRRQDGRSQAPTILEESQIASRLMTCMMATPAAQHLLSVLCSDKALRNAAARFTRLQLHVMCRQLGGGWKGKGARCRKLLKVSSSKAIYRR